jgi:hypothetical protein
VSKIEKPENQPRKHPSTELRAGEMRKARKKAFNVQEPPGVRDQLTVMVAGKTLENGKKE